MNTGILPTSFHRSSSQQLSNRHLTLGSKESSHSKRGHPYQNSHAAYQPQKTKSQQLVSTFQGPGISKQFIYRQTKSTEPYITPSDPALQIPFETSYDKVFNFIESKESHKRVQRIAALITAIPNYTPHIESVHGKSTYFDASLQTSLMLPSREYSLCLGFKKVIPLLLNFTEISRATH